ncbi:MAG: glutamate 5-kinase [Candidatus Dadabacteria bacterium]|nr:glutamate 5-kinase [Candidatus Dadabacteria bacterium]NIQ12865.1 glutamate 5-kinase [Candidatus Dadabacteria bacterium]
MCEISRNDLLKNVKTAVIKIGSSVLTNNNGLLDESEFAGIARQVSELNKRGINTVVVSSGAIASGMKKLNMKKRPEDIHIKQAISACGQSSLIRYYELSFQEFGFNVAQILLTQDDLSNRRRFLNARKTVLELLDMGIIPIINENDSVSFEEIMFGDNDNLAALVTSLIGADILLLISNVDGFYDKDPAKDENAKLLYMIKEVDSRIESLAGETTGKTTTGGMRTKMQAAKTAAAFGVPTIIANGKTENVIVDIFNANELGSVILPLEGKMKSRKHWIAFASKPNGKLILDDGAIKAITQMGKSLLPSGVKKIEGSFGIGEAVSIYNEQMVEVCRGLSSYSSDEINRIKGKNSSEIEDILGYKYSDEIIHRDEMAIISNNI